MSSPSNQYRCWLQGPAGQQYQADRSLLDQWQPDGDEFLWLDCNLQDEAEFTRLLQRFAVHELAVSALLRERHPPKYEHFGQQLLIIYRGLQQLPQDFSFLYQEIGFLVGKNFLISCHRNTSYGVDYYMADLPSQPQTPLTLALQIMRRSASVYLDALMAFDETLSQLEDDFMQASTPQQVLRLSASRSVLLRLKRVFSYHQRLTEGLLEDYDDDELTRFPCDRHLMHALNERFTRIYSLVVMHYEICGDLLESHMSLSSYHMNNKMNVLTMITAVFVPLGFLAGIYGMNFEYIPELKHPYGYFILVAVMAAIAGGMLGFFKIKKWF